MYVYIYIYIERERERSGLGFRGLIIIGSLRNPKREKEPLHLAKKAPNARMRFQEAGIRQPLPCTAAPWSALRPSFPGLQGPLATERRPLFLGFLTMVPCFI